MNNDKQNGVSIGVLAGLSLVVGGASTSASALMISDSDTFSVGVFGSAVDTTLGDGPVSDVFFESDTIFLDQFDPMGGARILTDVTFSLTSQFSENFVTLQVDTSGEDAIGSGYWTLFQDIFVLGSNLFFDTDSQSVNCSAFFASCNNSTTFNNIADGSTAVSPVSDFLGTGLFVVDIFADLFVDSELRAGDTATVIAGFDWSGTLTVEYTYDEVQMSVPEPLTLPLIGIGLAGMAAMRRRKSRA